MTDRELLESAARLSGEDLQFQLGGEMSKVIGVHEDGMLCMVRWNPLEDDGDALRLAVQLNLGVYNFNGFSIASNCLQGLVLDSREDHNGDPRAATRRAIVRAAASIGEQHKGEG